MIILDLINDEAPLFIGAIENLFSKNKLKKEDVIGVTEGNRWKTEATSLNTTNRLLFFDALDQKNIDIKSELNRISNEYDNTNIFASDRYLIDKPRALQIKLLVYTYLFFEYIFKNNTTHYFSTGTAYTYNLISYQVSLKYNVKHISFYGIRFKNKVAISFDDSNTFNEVDNEYKTFLLNKITNEMHEPILKFIDKPIQPAYMNNAINGSSINSVFIKEFFIRFKKYYFSGRHKYDFFTRNPFILANFKLKKTINAKRINVLHNTLFDTIDIKEKYFIFPLHMQPEASTLILAPNFVDQKTGIINISKLIPPNVKLYVKEHKSALGQHSVSFYKQLKKHPNIKLISYRENMFELIKNSLGTINLSSTVGLESLLLKKPAIILGNVFYNKSGLTFKVDSLKELKVIIQKIIKNNNLDDYFTNYDERIAFYIHCLLNNSYNFEFNPAKLDTKFKVMKQENISNFSECIFALIK